MEGTLLPSAPKATSAWIAPNGDFYAVPYEGHWLAACRIEGVAVDEADPRIDTIFEQRGWLHLSAQDIFLARTVTQAQLDTLWDVASLYPYGSWQRAELIAQIQDLGY